jgi:UDP-N-acetylglucosamine--N-acetylmuramyl-(pentapeptide) pyrophosphoryl-undecaprenol N-acetylglucosamine transferase
MKLLIAGGGTGGHLFPGVAIAETLRSRDPKAQVLFVGTERGIEARVLPELGWPLKTIEISGLKTVGLRGVVRGLLRIPVALWQSRRILKEYRPDAVIGVGGYASGPVVLAAWMMRLPTAVLEQNSIPGLTNKILGRCVRAVFIAFDETRRFFRPSKVVMSGTPIRLPIRERLTAARPDRPADDSFRLFVFGGSQGAVALNRVVVEAIVALAHQGKTVDVVHQTGERDLQATRQAYAAAGITADCRAFISDMAAEYHRADLVVARAGAATVAELAAAGIPALLVPYPTAADNHQEINARELAERGAAQLLRQSALNGTILAATIGQLMDDPASLERMRSAMKQLGKPHAAETVVDWLKVAGSCSEKQIQESTS